MRLSIGLVGLLVGCAPAVDSVVLDPSLRRAPKSRVALFRDQPPARPTRIHGYLASRESSFRKRKPTAAELGAATSAQMDALGREAAKMGCDAIVVRRSDSVVAQRPLIGPDFELRSVGHLATCLVFEP